MENKETKEKLTKPCACGATMNFKEGVSKAGRAWKGFFCPKCKAVEWLSDFSGVGTMATKSKSDMFEEQREKKSSEIKISQRIRAKENSLLLASYKILGTKSKKLSEKEYDVLLEKYSKEFIDRISNTPF